MKDKVIALIRESTCEDTFRELKGAFQENGVLCKVISDEEFDEYFRREEETEIIELDITDEQMLFIAKQAHKHDVTINREINNILREFIRSEGLDKEYLAAQAGVIS